MLIQLHPQCSIVRTRVHSLDFLDHRWNCLRVQPPTYLRSKSLTPSTCTRTSSILIMCRLLPMNFYWDPQEVGPQGTRVGWGIHLVEGWIASRVWLLVLSLFVTASLVFGVCWAVFEHDLQGAFGVAAYMVTLLGLVAGTLQANLI